jgi:hypothetical protein
MAAKVVEYKVLIDELSKNKPNQDLVKLEMNRLKIPFTKDRVTQLNKVMWQLSQLTIEDAELSAPNSRKGKS